MFRTLITAAILALTVTAAQAGDTVTVHVGDLDLTKAKDAQLLTARIHAAAERACSVEASPDARPVSFFNPVFADCVSRTSNVAMTKYQTAARAKAVANDRLAGN